LESWFVSILKLEKNYCQFYFVIDFYHKSYSELISNLIPTRRNNNYKTNNKHPTLTNLSTSQKQTTLLFSNINIRQRIHTRIT
jgi:hypothetical protein